MDPALESKFAAPWVQFCKEYGGMPMLNGPVENLYKDYNKMLKTIFAKFEIPPIDISVKTEDIQVNVNFKVRVYHPPGATGNDPLGIYIHGGGWTICDLDSEDAICRMISKSINMVLVSVDYRLGPQHKFPAALNDCIDAFDWALSSTSKLGVRKTNILVIGGSAGGNLAIGSTLKLIDEGRGAPISGVVALVPVTVHPDAVPDNLKHMYTAYEENAELTLNSKSAMLAFWDAYNPPKDNIYTSCLLHPRLKSLPKTYIAECGADTLRDDARLFRGALKDAGVDVKYDAYPGYPHWSWTFPSKSLAGYAGEFFGNFFEAIRWAMV